MNVHKKMCGLFLFPYKLLGLRIKYIVLNFFLHVYIKIKIMEGDFKNEYNEKNGQKT